MHLTMDFMTFLAVCSVVVGIGSFGIAALRIRNNGRAVLKNESGQMEVVSITRIYSIVREKLQEFYNGTCRSERNATREVIQAEMRGMKQLLETEIQQVNSTLSKGLEDIKREVENDGDSDTGSESSTKV